jgi:hypothetical protein
MRHIAKFIIAVFLLLAPFVVAGILYVVCILCMIVNMDAQIISFDVLQCSASICGICLVANGLYAVQRKKTQFPKLYITSLILLTLSIGLLCTVTLFFPLLLIFACCLVSLFITLFVIIREARNDVYTWIILLTQLLWGFAWYFFYVGIQTATVLDAAMC